MNPIIQPNPLERIAARGLAERQSELLEAHRRFFSTALRDLPSELRLETRLISASKNQKRLRLEIAGQPFDLETSYDHHWELTNYHLYHAGLALVPAIDALEDYSRERAVSVERENAKALWAQMIGYMFGTGLFGYGFYTYAARTPDNASPGIGVLLLLFALMFAAALLLTSLRAFRIYRLYMKPRLEAPSAAMQAGFEDWRSSPATSDAGVVVPNQSTSPARVQEYFVNAWGNGIVFYDVPSDAEVQSALGTSTPDFIFVPPDTPPLPSLESARDGGVRVSHSYDHGLPYTLSGAK